MSTPGNGTFRVMKPPSGIPVPDVVRSGNCTTPRPTPLVSAQVGTGVFSLRSGTPVPVPNASSTCLHGPTVSTDSGLGQCRIGPMGPPGPIGPIGPAGPPGGGTPGEIDDLNDRIDDLERQIDEIEHPWSEITGKPSCFPSCPHTHNTDPLRDPSGDVLRDPSGLALYPPNSIEIPPQEAAAGERTFDTVADMLAAPVNTWSAAVTLGWTTKGDGSRLRWIKMSDASLVENDDSVIEVDSGSYFAVRVGGLSV